MDQQPAAIAIPTKQAEGEKPKKSKLGFVRFFYVIYGIGLLFSLVYFLLASRDKISYDYSTIYMFLDFTLGAVCFWLIFRRLRMARWAVIIWNIVVIASSVLGVFFRADDPLNIAVTAVASGLTIAYFALGRRPREALNGEVEHKADEAERGWRPSMRTLAFWRDLLLYYCAFSILGHWMEAGFGLMVQAGLVAGEVNVNDTSLWRDWLYPFPTEGLGFAMCVLVLFPFKAWLQKRLENNVAALAISFVVNALVCTLVELAFGLTTNPTLQLWDYSDLFCNFMGQVCLQNTLLFGVASTVVTWVIYPFIARLLARVPAKIMTVASAAAFAFFAIVETLYLVNVPWDMYLA